MAKRAPVPEPVSDIELPDAVPDGTEYSQSLGRFVDNLLGAERMHRRAVQETEAAFPRSTEQPDDPPPAEPPPAVPDGTEYSTRGAKRPSEHRTSRRH
ncbi:MAG: hypothetical protein ABR548_14470 [Actinomycetota bacterium]|nr:hypothetical protein [Actinomycetota bacterium]